MALENTLDISIHLLKAANFDLQSDERHVVYHLLRVGTVHDAIYPEVPRLPLFNKLNELGLEVLYSPNRREMYLSPSSLSNYYENVMQKKSDEDISYYEKYIKNKTD